MMECKDDGKLRWQSWLVLTAVAPLCALAALRYAVAAWSGATQTGARHQLGVGAPGLAGAAQPRPWPH